MRIRTLRTLPTMGSLRLPGLTTLFAIVCSVSAVYGQSASAVAEREVVRRQEEAILAQKLVRKAEEAFQRKDYETAYVDYLDAVESIPDSAAFAATRGPLVRDFSRAAIAYANDLIANGRFTDAERVAKTILLPQFDPQNKKAVQLLSNLEQPDYYNKTVTPQFAAEKREVEKLLMEARDFYRVGRFDLANKRYEQVLLVDPYNKAARRGMEEVQKEKTDYAGAAYNETRSRMLWLVDREWERPLNRNLKPRITDGGAVPGGGIRDTEAITAKLNSIIIPTINLRETTVREAIEFLKQRSRDLDTGADSPDGQRGVNIVVDLPEASSAQGFPEDSLEAPSSSAGGNAATRVTMSLRNVPLIEAIRYLTELAKVKFKIEPFAVSIVPFEENTSELITKEYKVPPGFIPSDRETESGGFETGSAVDRQKIRGRVNAKAYLESQQVAFPQGAFAQYLPAGSRLIVRNTRSAIDLIDYLVDAALGVQPTQVEIESKFLEISQNNLDELGFDWLLGPFAIGSSGVFGAGGTEGYGTNANPTSPNANTFPFGQGGQVVGQNPVTAGVRSGVGNTPDAAITANSISALLANANPGSVAAAPAILGISGIFTNPQFQVVIRALSQKKGVDLMSAPKVTTKSGRKAVVRVVREFPYPTEFDPPQVPSSEESGFTFDDGAEGVVVTSGVVTPATPTAFETRNLGVTLEVEPIIGPDNYTIDLNLSPEVVEFDGFVNYGSPVFGPSTVFDPSVIGGVRVVPIVLTENIINQPIFQTRKVTTSVTIWDGQTVALGGLIREDVQKTQDKVPILGDIPLAGRLFRSNSDQTIKRNLIIFVTANLMDAEGRPIRQDDLDQEELVAPLGIPPNIPPPAFDSKGFGK